MGPIHGGGSTVQPPWQGLHVFEISTVQGLWATYESVYIFAGYRVQEPFHFNASRKLELDKVPLSLCVSFVVSVISNKGEIILIQSNPCNSIPVRGSCLCLIVEEVVVQLNFTRLTETATGYMGLDFVCG